MQPSSSQTSDIYGLLRLLNLLIWSLEKMPPAELSTTHVLHLGVLRNELEKLRLELAPSGWTSMLDPAKDT